MHSSMAQAFCVWYLPIPCDHSLIYPTLLCPIPSYPILPYPTLHYLTLHCLTLPYLNLPYPITVNALAPARAIHSVLFEVWKMLTYALPMQVPHACNMLRTRPINDQTILLGIWRHLWTRRFGRKGRAARSAAEARALSVLR